MGGGRFSRMLVAFEPLDSDKENPTYPQTPHSRECDLGFFDKSWKRQRGVYDRGLRAKLLFSTALRLPSTSGAIALCPFRCAERALPTLSLTRWNQTLFSATLPRPPRALMSLSIPTPSGRKPNAKPSMNRTKIHLALAEASTFLTTRQRGLMPTPLSPPPGFPLPLTHQHLLHQLRLRCTLTLAVPTSQR